MSKHRAIMVYSRTNAPLYTSKFQICSCFPVPRIPGFKAEKEGGIPERNWIFQCALYTRFGMVKVFQKNFKFVNLPSIPLLGIPENLQYFSICPRYRECTFFLKSGIASPGGIIEEVPMWKILGETEQKVRTLPALDGDWYRKPLAHQAMTQSLHHRWGLANSNNLFLIYYNNNNNNNKWNLYISNFILVN